MSMHTHGIANESETESTAYAHNQGGQAVKCPGGGWDEPPVQLIAQQPMLKT